jgi:hypothetical protein
VETDIGERMIIQRHQLRIGLLATPPLGESFPGGNEKVDH